MELHACDRWGCHLPQHQAFEQGLKIDLECIRFQGDVIVATPCQSAMPRFEVHCMCPAWTTHYMDVGRQFTLLDFQKQVVEDTIVLRAVCGELLPILHPTSASKKIGEAFSGLGGWTWGAALLDAHPVLMVDCNPIAAEACARSHGLLVMQIEGAIELARIDQLPDRLVVVSDILDTRVWVLAGLMHVSHWLGSPPCPPWSGASRQAGLDCPEGAIFAEFIYMLGVAHVKCVSLENVPGLPKHPHFKFLKQAITEANLVLVVSNVDRVHPLLPVIRSRWLATCVRDDIQVDHAKVSKAKNLAFPCCVPGVGKENSIGAARTMHTNLQPWELQNCVPTAEAMQIMSAPEYLPLNLRKPDYMSMNGEQVLALRTKTARQLLPSIMAMQGSQHLLPPDLLRAKGLHAFLLWDGEHTRFAAPFEIALSLGFPKELWLPVDFREAWMLTGNSLSIAHSVLQCTRTQWIVGDISGLADCMHGIFDVCKAVLAKVCALDGLVTRQEGAWMTVAPPVVVVPSVATTVIGHDEGDDDDMTSAVCDLPHEAEPIVSPTVTFYCEEPMQSDTRDPILVQLPPMQPFESLYQWTLATFAPNTGGLVVSSGNRGDVVSPFAEFHVMHSQKIWACHFNAQCPVDVGGILRRALPHASADHFAQIIVNDQRVWFHTILEGKLTFTIEFQPCSFPRIFSPSFMDKDVVCEVDVAWTFMDAAAFIATTAGVFTSAVQCTVSDETCPSNAFVLSYPHGSFDVDLIECAAPAVQTVSQQSKRVTLKHPTWGSIRSGSFPADTAIEHAIAELVPELAVSASCTHDGKCIDPRVTLFAMPVNDVCLSFGGSIDLPAERVIISHDQGPCPSECATILVHFRSPFAFRTQTRKVPAHWSVLDFVDSLLLELQCNMTLIVVCGGLGVDVHAKLTTLGADAVLDVRACGLLGGAKNNDHTTKQLHEMLVSRGVPDDVVASRISLIKSKIPPPELASMVAMDSVKAWASLKAKATETKIRLVTTSELKSFQKAQRQSGATKKDANPGGSSSVLATKPAVKKNRVKKETRSPVVVSIDSCHFHADGHKLATLSDAQWGPDATGILITTPDAAMKRLPVCSLSPDPLALIVVSAQHFQGVQPVTVPAVSDDGQPTLTSVCVLNFGDVGVSCKPSLLTADLPTIQTAIVEVTVVKQYVACWNDTRNVLNYLGLQLPELRRDKVIASWAFKPYGSDRAPTKHDVASYVHGFIRVPEEVLPATLVRSGKAGVFLQVKDGNKKPDARYGVITLHGSSLEEALQTAGAIKNALGIVQLGREGPFAIRAKREHLSSIRQHVLPQSIALQEGNIPTDMDATWWLLKHVQVSTTCADLTSALQKVGWDATVIRPSGRSAWLAVSKVEPPATHLCLGSDYVAIVPLIQTKQPKITTGADTPMVPAPVNFSMCPEEDGTSTTTASRMSDLEERLTDMINQKVQTVAATVNEVKGQLHHVVEETKKDFREVREQQATLQSSIQAQIQTSSSGILQQMQSMFQTMQQELQTTIQSGTKEGEGEPNRSRSRGRGS